ncbi:hypothetical protein L227DRAFT_560791 [Lentinus tigrinus ALCF2SS1-6]|uniref:Uncharacterized protein n=1 Tax=Lentinus tigrinus ALCF2SS1-6 TaxID=1328759 RepID=A0A5C2SPT1_9APHY|nr:hypothetical protein L227DRAFT_560791 [Lentinus tigrinus ALCF2SS1-6]
MFDDPDPFSDLFSPFFNPPTIVVSVPDVLSSLAAGIISSSSSSSAQPPHTTQAPPTSSTSTPHQATTSQSSRPPVRTSSTTHSPISFPSPTPSSTVDATTVLFNVTNILTETSLLTAPGPPSASAAPASSDVRTLPRGVIGGIVVTIVSAVAVVCLALLLLLRRRRAKRREERRAIPHPSSPLLFRCAGSQSPGPQSLREKTLNSQPRPQTAPSQAVPADEAGPATPRPRDSVVDMSYASDDYLPLMTASPSSSSTPRRVTRRERDGGLVPPSLYLDTSFEQYANQSVEYLPPAYDDLPPSPMSPITTTPMTHG